MKQFIVRKLDKEDIKHAIELRLEALEQEPTSFPVTCEEEQASGNKLIEFILSSDDNNTAIFGAYNDEQKLIGMIGTYKNSREKVKHKAYVWGTYVTPSHRGKHTGKELLLNVINHAINQMGCSVIYLSVVTDNIPAIKLYESCGFKIWGKETSSLIVNGKALDEYHMSFMTN